LLFKLNIYRCAPSLSLIVRWGGWSGV